MNYLKYVDIIITASGDNPKLENCLKLEEETTRQFNTFVSVCNANEGFSKAVNKVMGSVNAEYICLLNDDTEPQEDWLLHLIDRAESDKSIGVCGSKLLYPNTSIIQHAGIGFENGDVALYGRGEQDCSLFNYPAAIDFVTFACVLLRKDMIKEIGLLDEEFKFFYEDIDYCMRAREAGWKVFYEPKSMVYHYESSTIHKKDLAYLCGVSKEKFLEKWRRKLWDGQQ